jgi:hypothetical protein
MLLIYTKEDERPRASAEDREKLRNDHWALMDETRRRGILEGGEPLASTATATTVRHRDGKMMIIDGPFAETKEQLAGYYILDCKDLDEAIAWAAKIPTACQGGQGCVEIRQMPGLPPRDGPVAADRLDLRVRN